jgi:hypothetical protein
MKQTKETNIHALSWKQTLNPSNQGALDPHLTLHSHRDWLFLPLLYTIYLKTLFIQFCLMYCQTQRNIPEHNGIPLCSGILHCMQHILALFGPDDGRESTKACCPIEFIQDTPVIGT